ncbi:3-deoxy-manno-octulosonate-8-phosphatase KdsC [Methylovulum psychrotolerans]|jgi:3-deoxy-D-manno-octulosonate 8-phosphate phosphatase (KDO 8-P phosphatase)|uniref:3-deoxy-D-manno-octulosonate 8-phosphate phosphatase KdsC n=1 Tax=Methylovulum psychrotolerans TaxID=1704499 RepID=A0A1Z4C0N4_9GAMM|nr:3-deoxy-manno-octulosonate-8-phosphatase KdsC [Methylovulum psychrotolerans]ASF47071.1 3-deoxy-D-manno-octulosonate 8-phosphate phosphatase [Methylovulum psychrotolerans]MBT9098632.1 3-deoxy-manno-octulosonate-8-phosphatase KdsC [Methylovulum psychrotolerans]POZ52769.1 3-deoxy-manno-octulosonate-8-phosphatase KdsC [Methylovulum psychrotolerans]
MEQAVTKAAAIRLLILDVDGVLTDGKLFFDQQGNEYKSFHAQDGHGIKLLRRTGVEVAVISGRSSPIVSLRMNALGISHVYQGHEDKRAAFAELLAKLALTPEQVAYVGDDLLDLPIMSQVGLAVAVHDAVATVKDLAHWHTSRCGGCGAVREVCDLIMQAQGHYDAIVDTYLT